jgi:aminopeptidase N
VTVPADYTATANGVLRSVRTTGSEKRFRWDMRQPMTTWLATVHVNHFGLQLTRAADGTPIRVYYTDATPPADVDGYALSGEILTWMEERVGPYPFGSYGSVVVDDPLLYYALETQAMSTFPLGTADEATVAHELAHQWFGNSASIAKWEDLWIAEGAATYFEVLWPNRDDPAAFDAEMLAMYDYVAANGIGPAVVESPEEMFTDRTYLRGASALYALQQEVGDRTFFRILRTFVTAYRGRNATSQDFIELAVFVSGRPSVVPLLHAWLYDEPVPALAGYAAATALQEEGPALPPDVVGLRCGRGAHRGAPATCD